MEVGKDRSFTRSKNTARMESTNNRNEQQKQIPTKNSYGLLDPNQEPSNTIDKYGDNPKTKPTTTIDEENLDVIANNKPGHGKL